MRTAAYKVHVASDRRRRENEPRHILCAIAGWKGKIMELFLGGCYQGKKEYVLKLHPECKGQVIEGENLPADWDGMWNCWLINCWKHIRDLFSSVMRLETELYRWMLWNGITGSGPEDYRYGLPGRQKG